MEDNFSLYGNKYMSTEICFSWNFVVIYVCNVLINFEFVSLSIRIYISLYSPKHYCALWVGDVKNTPTASHAFLRNQLRAI